MSFPFACFAYLHIFFIIE